MKIFLFTLLLLSVYSCSTSEKKPAEITRAGSNISYTVCGEGDTTLLFIHGWCIDKSYWSGQADHFCPGYKVVTVDLPGFGQSGKNRNSWGFDEYASDIEAVIDHLKLKNVILIGHSMSGDIILKADEKYPEKIAGIIGIDNLHEPGGEMSEQQQKEMDGFFTQMQSGFDSVVSQYMKGSLFQPATDTAVVTRVMNSIFNADSVIATHVLRSLSATAQQEKKVMQQLSHKLYLVNSDVSPVKSDSLTKYCRRGFELRTVHATGHYPMIEKPAEFNKAIEETLHSISSGK